MTWAGFFLGVEQVQAELARPADKIVPVVTLSEAERTEALAWLKAPDFIGRLRAAFRMAGIIGEENNAFVAYLAGVSRKLERPLAIIIQSASAAGKTTLMDAVLAFFPEEERVKYSAMTGQSLYYLGETNLKHKILAIVEKAGAEKAGYALKLLRSEGELTIASTARTRRRDGSKPRNTGSRACHDHADDDDDGSRRGAPEPLPNACRGSVLGADGSSPHAPEGAPDAAGLVVKAEHGAPVRPPECQAAPLACRF